MVKGIIFDLDGTVVDSLDSLWRVFNVGVTAFKLVPVAGERLFALMNKGIGLADILREIYPELKAESSAAIISDIISVIRREYSAHYVDGVQLADGAQEMLGRIRARGLRIGVVTSRTVIPEKMWREFDRLKVTRFVDAVVTAAESRRKPAPEPIIECLSRLEIAPEDCIFVGDSQADMRAAQAAGVMTVAIAAGVSSREGLEAESPDFIFDNLPGFIKELDFVLDGC